MWYNFFDRGIMKKYIIGVDEGTTSCRSVLYDITTNEIVDISGRELKSFFPKSGWVEQDAEQIWKLQQQTIKDILRKYHADSECCCEMGWFTYTVILKCGKIV